MRPTAAHRRGQLGRSTRRAAATTALVVAGLAAVGQAGAQALPAWATMPAGLLPQRLPVASAPAGSTWLLQAQASDQSASDATPVRDFGGDWATYHPRSGRNAALQQARLDISLSRADWELGATLRSDILITGSRGAFDLVHAYKQRQTLAEGSALAVDAQETGVIWAGLRAAHSWTLLPGRSAQAAGLRLTAALTPLSLRRVQLTAAEGTVQYDATLGYQFDARTRQQDSHRQFSGWGTLDTTGSGITSDLGLLWQPEAHWFANLSVVDMASRLRIRGVATETMVLSSNTRRVDERGYLDYRPLISGRDSAADVRLQLLRKWSASAGVQAQRLWAGAPAGSQLGARWERIGPLNLPALWATLPLAPGWTLQLDAETRLRTLGLGVQGPYAALMLRSSGSRVGQAATLGWQATATVPW